MTTKNPARVRKKDRPPRPSGGAAALKNRAGRRCRAGRAADLGSSEQFYVRDVEAGEKDRVQIAPFAVNAIKTVYCVLAEQGGFRIVAENSGSRLVDPHDLRLDLHAFDARARKRNPAGDQEEDPDDEQNGKEAEFLDFSQCENNDLYFYRE